MNLDTASKTKQRILQSTLQIIAAHGFRSVTHRSVAHKAGVSLSATNYHFGNIDQMLYEAMAHYVTESIDRYSSAFENIQGEEQLIQAVMLIITEVPRDNLDVTILYELYAQASRDPRYRTLVQRWQETTMTLLSSHCSQEELEHLAAVWEGLIFLRKIADYPIPPERIRKTIQSIIKNNTQSNERTES